MLSIGIALTDMIYIAQGTGIASHFRCSASDSNIQRKEEAEEDWEDDEREKQHQHSTSIDTGTWEIMRERRNTRSMLVTC